MTMDLRDLTTGEAAAWRAGYAAGRDAADVLDMPLPATGSALQPGGAEAAPAQEPSTASTAGKPGNTCQSCGGQGWQYVGWARRAAGVLGVQRGGDGVVRVLRAAVLITVIVALVVWSCAYVIAAAGMMMTDLGWVTIEVVVMWGAAGIVVGATWLAIALAGRGPHP